MQRHATILGGLLPTFIALVLVLNNFEVIPGGVSDLLRRAWPVLLVIIGLASFLKNYTPYSGLLAVLLGGSLLAGVSMVAYSSRQEQQRDDQQFVIEEMPDDDTTLLVININMLATDIEIQPNDNTGRSISGKFIGSEESKIDVLIDDEDAGTAEITITEKRTTQFPLLEAVGRGTLTLDLPTDIGLALVLAGAHGDITLNLNDVQLERLDMTISRGDALVTLPAYEPRSPNANERPGVIDVHNGDVILFVPAQVSARLELNRDGNDRRPQFDDSYILIDDGADGTLEKRNIREDDIPLYYEVTAPRGLIRLETSGL